MKTAHVLLGTCITILLGALLVLQPGSTRANGAILTPMQSVANAGEEMMFTGSGFLSHERIAVWATDPTEAVITGDFAEAKGSGDTRFTFKLPNNAIGGTWSLSARGDKSHVIAVVSFEVYGRSPDSADFQAKVSPPGGPSGTTFAFAANGFDQREHVSYWITGPDGNVAAAYHQGTSSNKYGRVDVTWTAPSDAAGGRWVMTMQGYESSVARAIPFWVGDDNPDMTPTPTPTTLPTTAPTTPSMMIPTVDTLATAAPCQPCQPSPVQLPPTGIEEPLPAGEEPFPTATVTSTPVYLPPFSN